MGGGGEGVVFIIWVEVIVFVLECICFNKFGYC